MCCCHPRQQLRNFSDGEAELQRGNCESQGRKKCRELWENIYIEKKSGQEKKSLLQMWDSVKLKNKMVSVGKWEDGFVLEDVKQVTGFASHRKCIPAYVCKISVTLDWSIFLATNPLVRIWTSGFELPPPLVFLFVYLTMQSLCELHLTQIDRPIDTAPI